MNNKEHLVSDVLRTLKLGCDRNMIVYNSESLTGVPDSRLLSIMRATSRIKSKDKLQHLNAMYVDMEFLYSFVRDSKLLQEIITQPILHEHTYYLQGIKIIEVHDEFMNPYNKDSLVYDMYLNKLQGTLPHAKERLVIMFNENITPAEMTPDDVLLGAY